MGFLGMANERQYGREVPCVYLWRDGETTSAAAPPPDKFIAVDGRSVTIVDFEVLADFEISCLGQVTDPCKAR
jgi:hypothetical protein